MTVSSGVPILVVCIGRPELRERRPQWPVAAHLEPLAEEHVHELIGAALPAELRDRVTAAAGGNPLFVLEMLALAEKTQAIDVPPTLRALLTARLDQLQPSQRSVLDRAAVEGERFHRGAVEALGEQPVTRQLATLVDRQLIRPARPLIPGEDAFHFRHQLLRDAAYDALPKAARAVMHERLADWLEDRGGGLVELDEIAGYHLEQAVGFKLDLGHPDPGLAMRAGGRLAHAGRRALARADVRAASLLQRSLELTRPSGVDVALELDLSTSLMFVDPQQAAAIAVEAAERAHAAGDEAGEALARAVTAMYMTVTGIGEIDEVERLAAAALPLVEEAGDHVGLMYAWGLLAWVANGRARFEDLTTAFEQWVHHGRLAGRPRDDISRLCSYAFVYGPRPADEAIDALNEILADRTSPGLVLVRAQLLGMLGRFDEAWSTALPASERARELGDVIWAGDLASIASYAGNHALAADYMRRFCDSLAEQGDRAILSTFAPMLGRSLCALGRYDEAEPLAALGRELGAPYDIGTQMVWRQVQALVAAHRGAGQEAEHLAHEALEFAERSDSPLWQGDALFDLAEVLTASGRPDEAAAALEQALHRYERKKYVAGAARIRPRLAALRERAPASIG